MKRFLALAAALLAASLGFAQAFPESQNPFAAIPPLAAPPTVPPLPPLPDSFADHAALALIRAGLAMDRAGLVMDRAAAVLEEARKRMVADAARQVPLQLERLFGTSFVPVQLSFVPGLALPFGYHDVGLSLGAIGALTRDVQGLGASGIFNISRNVGGAELAGVFNIGEGIRGVQAAGIFNIAGGAVEGAQLAGIFNIAAHDVSGAQLGGLFNIGHRVQGFQGAGIFNISDDFSGPLQLAGLFNIAADMDGIQLAGLFTVADRVRGAQIAPIVNVADRVQGLQLGLVNIANRVDGLQFGLVNIAKNGVGGIGLLYEINSGYHWAFWQNGTTSFYTVFMGGTASSEWNLAQDDLVVSTGVGSRLNLGRPYLDVELAALWDMGGAVTTLQNGLGGLSTSGDLMKVPHTLVEAASLVPLPWASLRFSLGYPIFLGLHVIGGARIDIDLDRWPSMPGRMKTGIVKGGQSILDLGFTSYTKWFVGLRI